jgi:FKBP-type peptidyl-prolyl cis-trans isomerase
MKYMKSFWLLILFTSLLVSSCIKVETEDYTAEDEQTDLKNYITNLSTKGYNVDTTALGVYYVKLKAGSGPFPVAGDTISVKYVGYLMNGNIFDTSFYASPDSSWTYIYKTEELLASWDEVTGLMNEGCKMEFIIPSSLAYGSTGAGRVPPYSPLIFVAIMSHVGKKN